MFTSSRSTRNGEKAGSLRPYSLRPLVLIIKTFCKGRNKMDVYRVRGMTALNSLFYRWRIKEAFTTGSALRCRADAAPTPHRRWADAAPTPHRRRTDARPSRHRPFRESSYLPSRRSRLRDFLGAKVKPRIMELFCLTQHRTFFP